MGGTKMQNFLKEILGNLPNDWLKLTTHRLDIYNEELAKVEFLVAFEKLFKDNNIKSEALSALPTAYDYIRLGHPLSCVLEWALAKQLQIKADSVIAFSSRTMPVLAVLRKNLLEGKKTRIVHTDILPINLNPEVLRKVYGYSFELYYIRSISDLTTFEGSTILITNQQIPIDAISKKVDFVINILDQIGSILIVHGDDNRSYISDIQHVRRRETIAMTPDNCLVALEAMVDIPDIGIDMDAVVKNKAKVLSSIAQVTDASIPALVGSSGLSVQYAIMMGLIHDAQEKYKGKAIKFIVPPNCYGGTNDQARRVAACLDNVEIVDLPVDGDNNMVSSVDAVLDRIASIDAVPLIIAEIPTNPRVEVPDLSALKEALGRERRTAAGDLAIGPVFILDQTFCPNVHFLGDGKLLSEIKAISYASGSKFPSGGKCTAGYCVGNILAMDIMTKIENHLKLCDNEATPKQYEILAEQLPSMNQRIADAYSNTRNFVNFIQNELPAAKLNFVSEELAAQGFTPSVFSLDLPTRGNTPEEKETHKRALNYKLIDMMITEIPDESKYCVSYGQLKGCYWTIPATSTQGTTKEIDKDYIARVALSPDMDLDRHKKVFKEFVMNI